MLVDGVCFHEGRGVDYSVAASAILARKGAAKGRSKIVAMNVPLLAPKLGEPTQPMFLCQCGRNYWCPTCKSGASSSCGCK